VLPAGQALVEPASVAAAGMASKWLHSAAQPSPSLRLPSSHVSPGSRRPLPHRGSSAPVCRVSTLKHGSCSEGRLLPTMEEEDCATTTTTTTITSSERRSPFCPAMMLMLRRIVVVYVGGLPLFFFLL
jgi:hypothetical protein